MLLKAVIGFTEEKNMKKVFRIFDLTVDLVMIACAVGFVALVFCQVICRYLLNSSLTWSEEVCRYLFAELVFLGAGVCVLEKKHASVDIVVNMIPEKVRKYYQALLDLIVVLCGVCLTVYGYQFAVGAIGQTSPALQIPYQYIYAGIVIGGVILTIDGIRNLYTTLTGKKTYYSYINPSLNEEGE